MQTDSTYNGWKNYPTWCVNLWIDNDQGAQSVALEMARQAKVEAAQSQRVIDGVWTREASERYHLAGMLCDWVTDEMAPDLGASMAADMLGYALDLVDWNEIAVAYLDMVRDDA